MNTKKQMNCEIILEGLTLDRLRLEIPMVSILDTEDEFIDLEDPETTDEPDYNVLEKQPYVSYDKDMDTDMILREEEEDTPEWVDTPTFVDIEDSTENDDEEEEECCKVVLEPLESEESEDLN